MGTRSRRRLVNCPASAGNGEGVPRDFWLEDWEKQAIVNFHLKNPLEGYRRLTFMMLDADIVAVSPSSVWRVLGQAGLLKKWNGKPSKKGTGFEQPPQPHQHWHLDVSYINISGTFYYLCSVLDGYSRFLLHWEMRASMTEADIEIILQAAKEKYPEARPRIISDNGPEFIARDFKEFIRVLPPLTAILWRKTMRIADHPCQPCRACWNDSFFTDFKGLDRTNVIDDPDAIRQPQKFGRPVYAAVFEEPSENWRHERSGAVLVFPRQT
jgi:hypothetical protein